MSKFTPGPWVLSKSGSSERKNQANCISGSDGALIVYGQANDSDARLISAAPDLLDALREMVAGDADAIKEAELFGFPFPDEMLGVYRKAVAAILKATGDQR